jgi:hypothetical protein
MTHDDTHTSVVIRDVQGVEVGVGTAADELFLDLPITRPTYIRVREGDHVQEGDVRARGSFELAEGGDELASTTLRTWEVLEIRPDSVVLRDLASDGREERDREELEGDLATGVVSTNLTDFERVSVTQTGPWDDGEEHDTPPHVTVTAYGNDGRKFTRAYRLEDGTILEYWHQDRSISEFSDALRDRFERRVGEALSDDGYTVPE